jgi:hypothetical protein
MEATDRYVRSKFTGLAVTKLGFLCMASPRYSISCTSHCILALLFVMLCRPAYFVCTVCIKGFLTICKVMVAVLISI